MSEFPCDRILGFPDAYLLYGRVQDASPIFASDLPIERCEVCDLLDEYARQIHSRMQFLSFIPQVDQLGLALPSSLLSIGAICQSC